MWWIDLLQNIRFLIALITARKRSCGEVMFSHVSVCSQGVCLPTMQWGRQTPPKGRYPLYRQNPPNTVNQRQYASYLNAYLHTIFVRKTPSTLISWTTEINKKSKTTILAKLFATKQVCIPVGCVPSEVCLLKGVRLLGGLPKALWKGRPLL